MKVLLVAPHRLPGLKESRGSLPVSLLHLAGALRQAGHTPIIFDLSIMSVPDGFDAEAMYLAAVQDKVREANPGLVGINCFSMMHFPVVRRIAQELHSTWPALPICTGGAHPTFYMRDILENCPEFTFVVAGEGEEQIVALADCLEKPEHARLSEIQSFAFRDPVLGTVINPRRDFVKDLDTLPRPAYDLVDLTKYYGDHSKWHNPRNHQIALSMPIQTSRSCPLDCNFCSASTIMGRGLRLRNPKAVVAEIEMLARDRGQNYFSFIDDNVNANKKHFLALCEGITALKLDIQLCIAQGMYLNAVDEEIVRAFVKAGGITVSVPIEAANDHIRNKIVGKHLKDETIVKTAKLFKQYDLFTVGLYIMGFLEDTTASLNEIESLIHKLELDVNAVNTLVPFVGTKAFALAKRDNALLFDDREMWKGETFFDPQNKSRFWIKPYAMDLLELRRFRDLFDGLYFTSDRAKALNLS